jgi:RNA polymerase sigma-54 factor
MLRQTLSQKLLQKLSPQQIQLMKLLQLPTVALEQRIKEEMEINPALDEGAEDEEDEPNNEEESAVENGEEENTDSEKDDFTLSDYMDQDDDETAPYKLKVNNTSPDDERREVPLSVSYGFHDLLESQLGLRPLSDHQYQVASYLIGNIDDDGYLRRDLDSIVDDIAFSQNVTTTKEELEEMLHLIQEFDPAGVGARDLKECLLLQLERLTFADETIELAIEVVKNHMEEFSKKHYEKIQKKLDIDDEKLKLVIQEILKLNPKPGGSVADSKNFQEVIPDFTVSNDDGQLVLSLNSRNIPELKIAKVYQQMLEEYAQRKDKTGKEAVQFVKQKIESARGFIDAINQRHQTLLLTMQAIMDYQKEYFMTGDETKLKPMILKDISERVGLDISTISRVSNSKYVQTPFGTFLLKSFFSESLSTDSGEEVSSREVKKILQDAIEAENKKKPLTDDALAKILKAKGYNIARRTVAKYREQLEIPVARLRKEL